MVVPSLLAYIILYVILLTVDSGSRVNNPHPFRSASERTQFMNLFHDQGLADACLLGHLFKEPHVTVEASGHHHHTRACPGCACSTTCFPGSYPSIKGISVLSIPRDLHRCNADLERTSGSCQLYPSEGLNTSSFPPVSQCMDAWIRTRSFRSCGDWFPVDAISPGWSFP